MKRTSEFLEVAGLVLVVAGITGLAGSGWGMVAGGAMAVFYAVTLEAPPRS